MTIYSVDFKKWSEPAKTMSNNQNFTLEKISIDKQLWGEDKGKYKGKVTFSNGEDTFTFALNPTLCKIYLSIIKDTVVMSANELGNKIIASLDESTKIEETENKENEK